MNDVAIIGVGLHPFGRFGDKSAMEMGSDAVHLALTDAGIEWTDVQFAFGGSDTIRMPDAGINLLGLTGIPYMNVYNGCATAATALGLAADAIRHGEHDLGVAIGMDKHPRGAFTADPAVIGVPRGTPRTGSSSPPSSSA